jgi:murein DD-endopeptidase MepM/ murein hydrolase activator NlpD
LLATIAAGAAACGGAVYHRVQPGDTLYRIGKAYGVPYERLAEVNRIPDPSRIYVGQEILIPDADHQVPVDVVAPLDTMPRASLPDGAVPEGVPALQWPVAGGQLSSRFGNRGASFHDGIDIRAPVGTPVRAAGDGLVVYSATLRGYGNIVIVRHTDDVVTVYAHNDTNLVRSREGVVKGQVIAHVGETGRTSGPNLHFEVRYKNVAYDPLRFLQLRHRGRPAMHAPAKGSAVGG